MLFSIIYSVDAAATQDITRHAPPRVDELWNETECGDTEYGYLEGDWVGGQHRKWCSVLNREQFDEFVRACNLVAERTETMGSLGALGCGFWAPAISFRCDDDECIADAYVTPLPETSRTDLDEDDWNRIKTAVLAIYS